MQATLSHYRLLEEIGAGGMGVVYRARDERLERDVALKVLPAGALTDESARKRFRKEALALSRLNHPNVATVHDFDTEDQTDFLVEELIPGLCLSEMLLSGALPERDIINLGSQLCDGLAAAHEQGIIHRDLKPANIRVTPGARLKILDFGLAKVLHATAVSDTEATVSFTETQQVSGTLPYMAPEQLLNEKLDVRTDIWAAGCVLYEIATGRRPFLGSGPALTDGILHQPPAPPSKLNNRVAPGLEAIILKCLEKDPELRYASARDIAVDLHRLGTGAVTKALAARRRTSALKITALVLAILIVLAAAGWLLHRRGRLSPGTIRSIAVLPLENLSGDANQEYFADGMTEELITNIAKVGALKVISRTTVMQYKGTRKPAAQIAKELNVDALIEGSVLREGGQVRITAQLIQAATDQHLWAESYQRDLRGVLALQGEIASAIAEKVRATLTPTERTRLAGARPVNPEAYDAYLKGMQHYYNVTPQDLDAALQYFELALQKDPNYAPAYAGVSFVWNARQQMGWMAPREAGPKAKAAALKAVELDNTLAQSHSSLASVNWLYEWDWARAEQEFRRAIELNPSYPDARALYSHYLMIMQRPEEGMAQIQRALELDPLNPVFQLWYGADLEFADRYDEAIAQYRKVIRMSPEGPAPRFGLAEVLFRKALYEESLAEIKAYYARDRELEEVLTQGYAQSGYRGAMRRGADVLAARARKTYVAPVDVAALYAAAADKDQALAWLEKGLEVRDGNMFYINGYSFFDRLHSEPRFQALLRSMKLPQL